MHSWLFIYHKSYHHCNTNQFYRTWQHKYSPTVQFEGVEFLNFNLTSWWCQEDKCPSCSHQPWTNPEWEVSDKICTFWRSSKVNAVLSLCVCCWAIKSGPLASFKEYIWMRHSSFGSGCWRLILLTLQVFIQNKVYGFGPDLLSQRRNGQEDYSDEKVRWVNIMENKLANKACANRKI